MLQKTRVSRKKSGQRKIQSRRSVEFPGIVSDADALGIDRVTLWFARKGLRKGPKYQEALRKFNKLKGTK